MTKPIKKKMKSTYQEFVEAKTPAQRKKYEEMHRDSLLSEMILAIKEHDEFHVNKLATALRNNKYLGSSFESFLEEAGILKEVNAAALKAVKARNKTVKSISSELHIAQKLAYEPCGFILENFKQEAESQEYDAAEFEMNNKRIKKKKKKITPTKIGQFVTFWKRSESGPIAPYDISDSFDFLVVSVSAAGRLGQFVFPKAVLAEEGILSKDGKGGKRAMRVYPPWDVANNKQAKKNQAWQLVYFFEIQTIIEIDQAKKLFL